MDLEQLKLVLDAVQGVSGQAQLVAILWIAKGYFTIVVIASIISGVAFGGYKLMKQAILTNSFAGEVSALLGSYGWLTPREKMRALNLLRLGLIQESDEDKRRYDRHY